jgi:hypothetical protein
MSAMIATHLSFMPIAIALLCLYGLIAVVRRRDLKFSAVALGVAAPLAIAMLFLVASNVIVAKKPVISESSPLFLLARLIGDGPAREYLQTACPTHHYLLCDQLPSLTDGGASGSISDFFLWGPKGGVAQAKSPHLVDEAAQIDRETMKKYPVEILMNAALNGLRQLGHFSVDVNIDSPPKTFEVNSLKFMDDGLAQRYVHSPQGEGRIPLKFVRGINLAGVVLAIVGIALIAFKRASRSAVRSWLFVLVVVCGIAANALATGALSEVHDRYGNRVAWLLPLAALVLAFSALTRAKGLVAGAPPSERNAVS